MCYTSILSIVAQALRAQHHLVLPMHDPEPRIGGCVQVTGPGWTPTLISNRPATFNVFRVKRLNTRNQQLNVTFEPRAHYIHCIDLHVVHSGWGRGEILQLHQILSRNLRKSPQVIFLLNLWHDCRISDQFWNLLGWQINPGPKRTRTHDFW